MQLRRHWRIYSIDWIALVISTMAAGYSYAFQASTQPGFYEWYRISFIIVWAWAAFRPPIHVYAATRDESKLSDLAMSGYSVYRFLIKILWLPMLFSYSSFAAVVFWQQMDWKVEWKEEWIAILIIFALPLSINADCAAYFSVSKSRARPVPRYLLCVAAVITAVYVMALNDDFEPAVLLACLSITAVRGVLLVRNIFKFR